MLHITAQGKVGRKVLADISNSQGNLQKNEAFNGSKSGKVKMEKVAYSQRLQMLQNQGMRVLYQANFQWEHVLEARENVECHITQGRGDDINKFLWMVRIGGGVFPHIKEPDYLRDGQYRIDSHATPTMINYHIFQASISEYVQIYGNPTFWNRCLPLIKNDDKMIQAEGGVDALSEDELHEDC
ncbi:unnamed protein product [Lactuca virosa]|uniref:Helitron helicase-like domain-containing protein n=1 Tax=Lactuca virosa TaxID=75947 RepID=A0AAU9PQX7_9ASTR|nr:unnamed protein product [Lactuca virosa]